jgi:protein-tyrosine-phosphatase
MAAAIATAKLGQGVCASSAGIECGPGISAAKNAVTVMRERGIDISKHGSTDVEALNLANFDVVVAMDSSIAERLRRLSPKLTRLIEWSIPDPYGGDLVRYRAAADAITDALGTLKP